MYESYYNFSGSPFRLGPDPAFLFESNGHRRAYAYLRYGVIQAEGFVVITGEIGAGKTTLVRALLREIDPQKVLAVQLVSTQLDANDLLRSVALAFGLPARGAGKAQLLGEIESFLSSLVPRGRRALLVVDEAQNLGPTALEELRMLSNFQSGEQALLQSFLVGQPELRELMRAPTMQQLRQRIIAFYHLGPLAPAETRAYIEHRLRHVGWSADPALDDAAFDRIHACTGGLPRRINALCNRLLLGSYLAEKHEISEDDVAEAAAEIEAELGASEAPAAPRPAEGGATVLGERHPEPEAPHALTGSSVNVRLDRIERDLSTLLELVRGLNVERPRPILVRPQVAGAARKSGPLGSA